MEELSQKGWYFNLDEAKEKASEIRKPILLQFHRDPCSGCKRMYSYTYSDSDVDMEINRWFVKLRLDILKEHKIRSQYSAVWTPSFYVIDYQEKLYFSFPGYLPPEDFRMLMRLGLSCYFVPRGKYRDAETVLTDGIDNFPKNPMASRLLFHRSMARYLLKRDNKSFKREITEIRKKYPNSLEADMYPWTD